MYKKTTTILLFAVLMILVNTAYAQLSTPVSSGQGMPPQPAATVKPSPDTLGMNQLTPEQQQAVQNALNKNGGTLTPQAIESLKQSPEFKNLKPEEIIKGKEILDKTKKADVRERLPDSQPKITIGGKDDVSLFDRSRFIGQSDQYQNIPSSLKPFGYDFFQDTAIRAITDRKDIPVHAKYIIGPGDEVKIMLWGRVNAQYNLVVDRNGSITIPSIGPLYVAGMTFEQMSTYLIKQSEQIVGANIDITMGALKTIPVFILGEVKRPGAFLIGSFATITDALLLAGGPTAIGTMRNVQLRRKDKVITAFDLYNLLLKGDKSNDVILQAGDVVFVPVSGPQVGIAGNVRRPAIYELKDRTDLQYAFDLAGGIIPAAYTQQIQIERIIKNEKAVIVDINDKNLDKSKNIQLQDADLVKVFPIVEAKNNIVQLYGHVKKPGTYELKPDMRLRDIIKGVDDLLQEPYLEYALIKRLILPGGETVLIPFSLRKLILASDKEANIKLMPQDSIYVFSAWMFQDRPSFTIAGEVRRPDRFEFFKQTRVKDAILAAGGLTREAYLEKGQVLRIGKNRQYESIIYFNVDGALSGKAEDNILLQDEDVITIRSISEVFYKKTVTAGGAVSRPGSFEFAEKMTVKDLIFAAGNVLESAYLEAAELSSMIVDEKATARTVTRVINLKKALEGDPENNVELTPYDRLFVRTITDWRLERYVTISGQVKFSGKYMIRKGEKLSSLIKRSGGYLENAYLRGAVFTRERVRIAQQKSLEEMADRMEKDFLVEGSGKISTSLSAEEIQARQQEMVQKKKLIENVRNVKAKGRMTIKLAQLYVLKGSEYDIELEDGDILFIPEKSSVVGVVGSVMGQGAHIFSEKADYQDYINMSGGYSEYADKSSVFVLKVDGGARRAKRGLINWRSKSVQKGEAFFSEEDSYYIEPGDVIVVPEKFERIAWLREIKDITQILMNTAVAAGVVIALF